MDMILPLLAYLLYGAFGVRFATQVRFWLMASDQFQVRSPKATVLPFFICSVTVLDLLFFRRLFATDKILWPGSWLFHLSFLVVLLRHLRYFLQPVPDCIAAIQPFGVVAGYLLAAALAYVLGLRIFSGSKRYVSWSNFGMLSLLLCISLTGLLMRILIGPDLGSVKAFIIGLFTFSPVPSPGGLLFGLHFLLAVTLLPLIPSHLFTAPLVAFEAVSREEDLKMVLHEK